jgi:CIC family chloride channel protein
VLSGVIVAAALAAVIERSLMGENAVFSVPESYGLRHASSLLLYAGIGLAAAVASTVFTESLLKLRARMRRVSAVPRWAHPSIGGAVTGALAVVGMLTLHTEGVAGGGYATLGQALNGHLVWWVLLGLSALKLIATVASYSTGGAGGIFAPTLFIGGTLGGAIGVLDTTWFGHTDQPMGAFALVGMGAMFAGVVRAPMTSVLIIIEMTHGYSLILPLMIANMTAYVLARRYRPQPIYEALLEQDGVKLGHSAEAGDPRRVISFLGNTQLMALSPAMSAAEVLLRCSAAKGRQVYPVVDAGRRLLGIVTPDELAILTSSEELLPLATASDLMRAPISVRADDHLGVVVERMLASGLREIPVLDDGGRLLGCVDDQTLATAYQGHAPPIA